jgi:hypothetical protein
MSHRSRVPRRARPAPARSRRCERLNLEILENRWLPSAATAYGQLPLSFERNLGQADPSVDFLARGSGYTVYLTGNQAVLALQSASSPGTEQVLDMRLLGANTSAPVSGQGKLPGASNYYVGSDPAQWRTNIPNYAQVQYQNVYPGIDLVYHGSSQTQLEYDLIVDPGAHVGEIRIGISGINSMSLDAQGDLVLHTATGDVVEQAPLVYQTVGGVQRSVSARYVLQNNGTIGFAVAGYDASLPLVIDPVIKYSTYLGGVSTSTGSGIVVDNSGDTFITGNTSSTDFPTTAGAYQSHPGGGFNDAFVAELNPQGSALIFSTYFGGSGLDYGAAIARDANGDLFITGETASTDFPTLNPLQATHGADNGGFDAFVAKFNYQGSLLYSTYLGGSGNDSGNAIAVNSSGNAYVTGSTNSSDFPLASPLPGYHVPNGALTDAFVAEVNTTGNALVYSTYLGGAGSDSGQGIAVDSSGDAYVAGWTASSDFPTLNALQATLHGTANAFVTKLNATGNGIDFSTYLGGSGSDHAQAITLDANNNPVIAGYTASSDFPTVAPYQSSLHGTQNAFITKLTASGNAYVFSTYLGGSGTDEANGVALDPSQNIYVVGDTSSSDFPTALPVQAHRAGTSGDDAFVAKLAPSGNGLSYSTYLGGSGDERGFAIAVDLSGDAFVTGYTSSTDFPTTAGAFQTSNRGSQSAFVTELSHLWTARGIAVGSDGNTRLEWGASDGRSDTWVIDNSFHATAGPAYGIFSGWGVQGVAAGPNGATYVLWDGPNSSASLWLEDAQGNYVSSGVWGVAGWDAIGVTVGSDGLPRILWLTDANFPNTENVDVWTVDHSYNVTPGPVYQVYGFATGIAGGSDGLIRVLITVPHSYAAEILVFNNAGVLQNSKSIGGNAEWFPTGIAAGPNGQTYVLWDYNNSSSSSQQAAAIWQLNSSYTVTAAYTYSGGLGFAPAGIAVAGDGTIRLLWNNPDGTAAVWLLSASGVFEGGAAYGPY